MRALGTYSMDSEVFMSKSRSTRNNRSRGGANANSSRDSRTSDVRTQGNGGTAGTTSSTAIDPTDWMVASDVIAKSVASISFNTATGAPVDLGLPKTVINQDFATIPGVMTLTYLPTPGISTNNNSAVNLAARALYSYVRHANSGHSNYDAPDLMMYLLAMDSMYSYLSWARRLYGYLSLYTQYNRYVPRALIEANGVNYDDLMANPAKFRSSLNLLIQSAGALVIPNSLGFIKKHMWMTSNCYLDDMSVKAQLYQFVPEGYWKYDELNGPGQLTFTPVGGGKLLTIDEVIAAGRAIINPLVGSEDINIMSGDILKAYGNDGIFKVGLIDEDYSVVPSYNPSALNIIQNATMIDGVISTKDNVITQDVSVSPNGGAILYNPTITATTAGTYGYQFTGANRILTMHKDDITPRDVITATMGMVCTTGNDINLKIRSCGSEIFRTATISRFTADTNGNLTLSNLATQGYVSVLDTSQVAHFTSFLKYTAVMNYFNDHPAQLAYTVKTEGGKTSIELVSVNLDVDNYAVISPETLDNIHDASLMAMFNVPIMGVFK